MSNIKYNVGDRVRIREWADMERQFGLNCNGNIDCKFVFIDDMRDLCGKVFVIKSVDGDRIHFTEDVYWSISTDMIEPLQQKKIVITADGCETLARLYDGNKVVKTATAKCSPDDTFDFNTGVKIAMERLMGEDKPIEKPVEKPTKKPTYFNGKVKCVKSPYHWFTVGKVYDVVDGKITADDGDVYPHGGGHYVDAEDVRHAGADGGKHNFRNEFIPYEEEKPDTTQTEFVVGDYYKHDGYGTFDAGVIKIVKKDGERFYYEIIAGLKKDTLNHRFTVPSCFAQHLTPYTGWKVVDRKPKVGDFIRLVRHPIMFTFDRVGDVLQIDGIDHSSYVFGKNHKRDTGDDGNWKWHYHRTEYEIVEPVLETEKPKKTEKTEKNPTFQMGDRVSHAEWGNGTVICESISGNYGVEFDKDTNLAHNCQGVPKVWGKEGTKNTSHWCSPTELTLLPKKYNGKVVCVGSNYSFWTVGKVYEIKDGIIVDDHGTKRHPIESLGELPMVTSPTTKFVHVSDDPSIGETPKGYTGKVVAVKRGYERSASLGVVTLGKVYTVKDGIATMDGNYPSCWYKTLDDFCRGMGWTFLPVAE